WSDRGSQEGGLGRRCSEFDADVAISRAAPSRKPLSQTHCDRDRPILPSGGRSLQVREAVMTGVREELAAGIAGGGTSILPSLNVKTARSCRGILPLTHLAREGRMTVTIGRRELLVALGGAAAWPLAARGQQPAMPVVGLLSPLSPGPAEHVLDAFRR